MESFGIEHIPLEFWNINVRGLNHTTCDRQRWNLENTKNFWIQRERSISWLLTKVVSTRRNTGDFFFIKMPAHAQIQPSSDAHSGLDVWESVKKWTNFYLDRVAQLVARWLANRISWVRIPAREIKKCWNLTLIFYKSWRDDACTS